MSCCVVGLGSVTRFGSSFRPQRPIYRFAMFAYYLLLLDFLLSIKSIGEVYEVSAFLIFIRDHSFLCQI